MHLYGFVVFLYLQLMTVSKCQENSEGDQRAVVPVSVKNTADNVVIQLEGENGANMKLKLIEDAPKRGVLVPLKSSVINPLTNTSSVISHNSLINANKTNISSDTSKISLLNISGSSTNSLKQPSVTSGQINRTESVASRKPSEYSINMVKNNGAKTLPDDNVSPEEKVTLTSNSLDSLLGLTHLISSAYPTTKHDGDATEIRIEVNPSDFQNMKSRPFIIQQFKSILKNAIHNKQRTPQKQYVIGANKTSNQKKKKIHINKLIERQSIILEKKAEALDRMAKLASKNLMEIKRLEQEAYKERNMLLSSKSYSPRAEMIQSELGKYHTQKKAEPDKVHSVPASSLTMFENKDHLESPSHQSATSLTNQNVNIQNIQQQQQQQQQQQSTPATTSTPITSTIVSSTTTTDTTTTTSTSTPPTTVAQQQHTTPEQQVPPSALIQKTENQTTILEKDLDVLGPSPPLNGNKNTDSSSSPPVTVSSMPSTVDIESTAPKQHITQTSIAKQTTEDVSSNKNKLPHQSDEMEVGDSAPAADESLAHPLAQSNADDNKSHPKKKQKIKILILNDDEEIPAELKSKADNLHMINTDTSIGEERAFKKELCSGSEYIKCLERSTFENNKVLPLPSTERIEHTSKLENIKDHNEKAFFLGDHNSRNLNNDNTMNDDEGENLENYKNSLFDHDYSEEEAQEMEFAMQSAAADASKRHYQQDPINQFLPNNADGGFYFKRNRKMMWEKNKKQQHARKFD